MSSGDSTARDPHLSTQSLNYVRRLTPRPSATGDCRPVARAPVPLCCASGAYKSIASLENVCARQLHGLDTHEGLLQDILDQCLRPIVQPRRRPSCDPPRCGAVLRFLNAASA
jgi:hypothetical protein